MLFHMDSSPHPCAGRDRCASLYDAIVFNDRAGINYYMVANTRPSLHDCLRPNKDSRSKPRA
jgi:hypothetical protein